jgi:hypothetical protein
MHQSSFPSRLRRARLAGRLADLALFGSFALMVGCTDGAGGSGATQDLGSQTAPDLLIPGNGLVRVASATATVGAQTSSYSSAIAYFLDPKLSGGGCQLQTAGMCQLASCTGSSVVLPTAGAITIGGGTQPISLTPRADGSYTPYANSSSVVFPAAQKLTVDAAGQAVPLFHGELTPPASPFTLTTPSGSRINILFTLNRKQDFALTWTPTASPTPIHVELNQGTDSNHVLLLECDFDGPAGTGTLPASLLSAFALSANGMNIAELLIGPATSNTVTVGTWDLGLTAITGGRQALATVTDL